MRIVLKLSSCCLLISFVVVSGCVSSETMRFTAVSVSDVSPHAQVVQQGVVGEDCPKGSGSNGSYAEAIKKAIQSDYQCTTSNEAERMQVEVGTR